MIVVKEAARGEAECSPISFEKEGTHGKNAEEETLLKHTGGLPKGNVKQTAQTWSKANGGGESA